MEQGQSVEAYAPLLSEKPPAGSKSAELGARLAYVRGHAAQIARKDELASTLYREAASRAASVPDCNWTGWLLTRQAQLALKQSRYETAAADAAAAIPRTQACGDRYLEVSLGTFQAQLYQERYRDEDAISDYRRALDIAGREDFRSLLPLILGNLALSYYRLGDSDKALEYVARAEAFYRQNSNPDSEQVDIGTRARVYLLGGDYANAAQSYRKALAIARSVRDKHRQSEWLNDLSSVYLETNDLSRAEAANDESVSLNDADYAPFARLNKAAIARARLQFDAALHQLRDLQSFIALHSVHAPELDVGLHGELMQVFAGLNDGRDAQREFSSALDAAPEIKDEWAKITFFAHVLRLYRTYVSFLVSHKDDAGALRVVESSRARILSERLGVPATEDVDFERTARMQQAVVLSYWLAPRESYLWVTTGDGTKLFHLPSDTELTRLIRQYNGEIQDLRDADALARRLYGILIAPAAQQIASTRRVIVIPDGALTSLNFETLKPTSSSYLLESATFSVAPSLSLVLPEHQGAFHPQSLLLIGVPNAGDPSFPELPGATREVSSVAQRFANRSRIVLLAGGDATPARFAAAHPENFSLIHIAAHAVANRDSPLDSAILLSSGSRFYARDLESMQLRARLVTLSACHGAGARAMPGEGLVGLAWAFQRAGARNVIAGLWNVSDASTADLMDRLYAHLQAGESPPDALRAAKLEFIRANPRNAQPYYWAGFQLYSR